MAIYFIIIVFVYYILNILKYYWQVILWNRELKKFIWIFLHLSVDLLLLWWFPHTSNKEIEKLINAETFFDLIRASDMYQDKKLINYCFDDILNKYIYKFNYYNTFDIFLLLMNIWYQKDYMNNIISLKIS